MLDAGLLQSSSSITNRHHVIVHTFSSHGDGFSCLLSSVETESQSSDIGLAGLWHERHKTLGSMHQLQSNATLHAFHLHGRNLVSEPEWPCLDRIRGHRQSGYGIGGRVGGVLKGKKG